MKEHRVFCLLWHCVNLLLAIGVLAFVYSAGWEYSTRRYLNGFSDAIVPDGAPAERKVQAILGWMRDSSTRVSAADPEAISYRDPRNTLNVKQLLNVCGTATNAFLNLARASDLKVRRLLLLGPDGRARHIVAEVLIGERWVIADPTYRMLFRDARGRPLTRQELRSPEALAEATGGIPGYAHEYTYESVSHIRVTRIPLVGAGLRRAFDAVYPGWDEALDWSLILERTSFAWLFVTSMVVLLVLSTRAFLGWYADRKLGMPRLHLREQLRRAGLVLFSSPR